MDKYIKDHQLEFNFLVSSFCAFFRKKVVKITLNEMSETYDIPVSTIANFEQGHSSNLRFIYLYLTLCKTQQQKNIFINSVSGILERSYHNRTEKYFH